jgi:O-antigen/teichoic acid export membrane protein
VVPLLNALQHFDIHRLNRADRFGPLVVTNTLPPALSLLAIWPLAIWLGDWRVMLWALVLHAALAALLSHLLAERAWRAVADRALWARTIRFGWPILLNALVLFLVFQVDKLAVGRILGLAPLGVFAMGVTLTLTPSLVAARTIQTALLPRLSAVAGTPGFEPRAQTALAASMAAGFGVAVLGPLGAWIAAPFLTGTDWADLIVLLGPLAVVQGLRIAKSGSTIVALALGRSGNAVLSNLPRVVALAAGIVALSQGADLLVLIWLGAVGEAVGFALSTALVTWRDRLRWRAAPIAGFAVAMAGVIAVTQIL